MQFKAWLGGTFLESKGVISTWWGCRWRGFTRCCATWVGQIKINRQSAYNKKGSPVDCPNFNFSTAQNFEELLLFLNRRSWGRRSRRRHLCRLRGTLARTVHAFLEIADPFTQAAHNFRDLLATEQQHNHRQNN